MKLGFAVSTTGSECSEYPEINEYTEEFLGDFVGSASFSKVSNSFDEVFRILRDCVVRTRGPSSL